MQPKEGETKGEKSGVGALKIEDFDSFLAAAAPWLGAAAAAAVSWLVPFRDRKLLLALAALPSFARSSSKRTLAAKNTILAVEEETARKEDRGEGGGERKKVRNAAWSSLSFSLALWFASHSFRSRLRKKEKEKEKTRSLSAALFLPLLLLNDGGESVAPRSPASALREPGGGGLELQHVRERVGRRGHQLDVSIDHALLLFLCFFLFSQAPPSHSPASSRREPPKKRAPTPGW